MKTVVVSVFVIALAVLVFAGLLTLTGWLIDLIIWGAVVFEISELHFWIYVVVIGGVTLAFLSACLND